MQTAKAMTFPLEWWGISRRSKKMLQEPQERENSSHIPLERFVSSPEPFPNHSQPFALPGQQVPGKVQVKPDFPKPLLDNL